MGSLCHNGTIQVIILEYDRSGCVFFGSAVFITKYYGWNRQISLFCFLLMRRWLSKMIFEQLVQELFLGSGQNV